MVATRPQSGARDAKDSVDTQGSADTAEMKAGVVAIIDAFDKLEKKVDSEGLNSAPKTENSAKEIYCTGCLTSVSSTQGHTRPSHVPAVKDGVHVEAHLVPKFELWAHSTGDLVSTIIQYVTRKEEDMDARQKYNVTHMEFWKGTMELNMTKYKKRIGDYFHILDRIFFCGALTQHTSLRFVDVIGKKECVAKAILNKTKPEVDINVAIHSDASELEKFGQILLEHLLHEMIHAFLQLFHCHCGECLEGAKVEIGKDGHGTAFKKIESTLRGVTEEKLEIGIHGNEGSDSEAEYAPSEASSGSSAKEVVPYKGGKGGSDDGLTVKQQMRALKEMVEHIMLIMEKV